MRHGVPKLGVFQALTDGNPCVKDALRRVWAWILHMTNNPQSLGDKAQTLTPAARWPLWQSRWQSGLRPPA
jgi:hypothetical protein